MTVVNALTEEWGPDSTVFVALASSVDGRVEELDVRCPEPLVGWTVPPRSTWLAAGRVLKATS